MSVKNYYDVLDLSPTATSDEIKEAYRLLVSMLHPDKFPPGSKQQQWAHTKVQGINEAYSVLKDPQRRSQYDAETTHRKQSERDNDERRFREEQQRKQAADAAQRQRDAETRRKREAEAARERDKEKPVFCAKCGTRLQAIGTFCSHCGYATTSPPRQQSATSDNPTVIGGLSHVDYSEVFARFETAGGKWVPSFNLLAFFIGPIWYLLKGMWPKAVGLGLASFVLISITGGAGVFIPWLYYGFFANWDLYLFERQGKQGW
jgi:hypothetical protein